MSTHTHSPLVRWSKPVIAAHISSKHPEHLTPRYPGLVRWTFDELVRYHHELHHPCTHPRVLDYCCQICGAFLGDSVCPGGERV